MDVNGPFINICSSLLPIGGKKRRKIWVYHGYHMAPPAAISFSPVTFGHDLPADWPVAVEFKLPCVSRRTFRTTCVFYGNFTPGSMRFTSQTPTQACRTPTIVAPAQALQSLFFLSFYSIWWCPKMGYPMVPPNNPHFQGICPLATSYWGTPHGVMEPPIWTDSPNRRLPGRLGEVGSLHTCESTCPKPSVGP